MAITGSDYTVETDLRDSLESNMSAKADNFSNAVGGAASSGGFLGIGSTNAGNLNGKAGITPDMVNQIRAAYDSYIEKINNDISQIENPEINQAFKGSSVEAAFKTLVSSVKEAAKNFTKSLQDAEMQIIEGVQKAYENQDTAVASNITDDSGSLS